MNPQLQALKADVLHQLNIRLTEEFEKARQKFENACQNLKRHAENLNRHVENLSFQPQALHADVLPNELCGSMIRLGTLILVTPL